MWIGALSALPPSQSGFSDDVRMTPGQTEAVVAAIADALHDAELTIDELSEAVVDRTGPWAGDLVMPAFQGMWPRWRQAMHLAGNRGALCFGPNRGRKVTYTSPRRWLPGFEPADARAALAHVVRSYLHAYGPATPRQFAQWLGAPARWATELFDSLAGELQQVEVEGARAGWRPATPRCPSTAPRGVRLLPYFDAYARSAASRASCSFPAAPPNACCAGNFQVLLVDGVVAGLWHQRRSGRRIDITVEPLERAHAPRSATSSTTRWNASARSSKPGRG